MSREVRALSTGQIARAAFIVLLGFLASGVLGMVRTAAYAATFGTRSEMGAFYGAQQIPELLFTLVAGGALGSAFIPVFARYLDKDNAHAWRLASAVMSWSALAAAGMGLILAVTAPLYMPLLLSNLPEQYQLLAADLARWMLITTVIFSISGLMMGILNAHQQFLLPALAISMNNIGLIIGAVVFARIIPTDSGPFAYNAEGPYSVYGLAFGAILGAVLHLVIQLPGLYKIRGKIRPMFSTEVEGSGQVIRLMLPRMLGLAVTQLNFLVNIYFAQGMIEGSIVVMRNAWLVMFFVLGILAQGVGTAVFPSLAKLAAEKDFAGFGSRLTAVLSGIVFLGIPASVGLVILGEPVVSVMFLRGEWTVQDSIGTAWTLAFFVVGIVGHGLLEVLSRAFYALSDTRTPVLIGVMALISNIILSVVFIQFIGDPASLTRGPTAGLALANSVTTLLEAAALWFLLSRRIGTLNNPTIYRTFGRGLAGAGLMALVVAELTGLLGDQSSLILVAAGGGIGVIVYFAVTGVLGAPEARSVPSMVLRRFRR